MNRRRINSNILFFVCLLHAFLLNDLITSISAAAAAASEGKGLRSPNDDEPVMTIISGPDKEIKNKHKNKNKNHHLGVDVDVDVDNVDELDDDTTTDNNICRVSAMDTYNTNDLGESGQLLCCYFVNEFGISDFFMHIDREHFSDQVVHQNKASLRNATWFIEYDDDWAIHKTNPMPDNNHVTFQSLVQKHIIKHLVFPQDMSIQSLTLGQVEVRMEQQLQRKRRHLVRNRRRMMTKQQEGPTQNTNSFETMIDDLIHKKKEEHRRLSGSRFLQYQWGVGQKTVKIVLVNPTTVTRDEAYAYVFGNKQGYVSNSGSHMNSFQKQLAECSNSQMTIVPHPDEVFLELATPSDVSRYTYPELYNELVIQIRDEYNLGIESNIMYGMYDGAFDFLLSPKSIASVADQYIFIVPDSINHGNGEVAWAPVGGFHFGLLESWVASVQTMLHEFGHNLGNSHAHEDMEEYEDTTTVMGASEIVSHRCYNGQNMWRMNWFPDNRQELSVTDPTDGYVADQAKGETGTSAIRNRLVKLAFYGEATSQQNLRYPVIIKIGDLFLTFNRNDRMNDQTGKYPDTLLIVEEISKQSLFLATDLIDVIPMVDSSYNFFKPLEQALGVPTNHTFTQEHFNNKGQTLHIALCEYNDALELLTLAIGYNEAGCASPMSNSH